MPILIFQLIVLIFSVMIHEIAHGAVALSLGDETAKRLGRLTLNPLVHLDAFGSVFLPLFLVLIQSPFVIGWAKPVPYNPNNLRNPKVGGGLIAASGPAVNLILAVVFGGLTKLAPELGLAAPALELLRMVVLINIVLAVFNLVPIPPLDGSKILFMFLPNGLYRYSYIFEVYGFIILFLFILFLFPVLYPVIDFVYKLLT